MDRLATCDTWIFDLDNTLYPESCDLFGQINRKMMHYMVDLLKVSHSEADRIRQSFYEKHGTTLNGLMMEYDADPEPFLAFVHDIDVSEVTPAPELAELIATLPGRRLIHTNGSLAHANRVLDQLGLAHVFDGIFDIIASDYVPKPKREAFDRMAAHFAIETGSAAMFEDKHENLEVPHALGMHTIWVSEALPETGPAPHTHLHFQTHDLRDFLSDLHTSRAPSQPISD